jgi:ubiquinone/menaquinone biosynthesis C-methylase UbiE
MSNFYETKIFPIFNDLVTKDFDKYRKELLKNARGEVLELGMGSGFTLPYYPIDQVTRVVGLEPNQGMIDRVQPKLDEYQSIKAEVVAGVAEKLPFPDNSFDTVVCFLVLCTVKDQEATLEEIKRILKPDGIIIYLEHVHWPDGTIANKFYDRMNPAWKKLACGCNLNRHTVKNMQNHGFQVQEEKIQEGNLWSVPISSGLAHLIP